jgi:DNA-directed RNA polymerase specialized sigma subunit
MAPPRPQKRLTEAEKNLVVRCYGLGKGPKEIGAVLNKTPNSISKFYSRYVATMDMGPGSEAVQLLDSLIH